MNLASTFNLCKFLPGFCVEKLSLPARNNTKKGSEFGRIPDFDEYLTFDECTRACKNLDSQVMTKTHLTSMLLVQDREYRG